ncbi:acyl-CoA dehydrogenase family protein [Vibrio spartinae]|uniref:Acyl-CoA dehydrogenase/oxidase C-terminal domain-containing protein n=1 Tax=Vibrio spartinae TaxID=1918945 RepID=A0A1N6M583_9VIBR|nr:acyl-CoA dehydrogenase family protein [Vibrio spartinae]QMV15010.1 hypothetical protein Vspart_02288 [Vibrio spartinae]SIO94588.1 hypothetical protein VSP9026_02313 [Vibrio spartinae]
MNMTAEILDQAYAVGRKATPRELLPQLGFWMTGKNACLVSQGLTMFPAGDSPELVNVQGETIAASHCTRLPQDRILRHLALETATVDAQSQNEEPLSLAVCAIRLGLTTRILDLSFNHLKDRKSFGQKTTRHQLIKASFSDIYGDVSLLKQQLHYRLDSGDLSDPDEEHRQITQLSNQAEKLMGGHGFLLGNSHTISHFSMLLYSLFGKSSSREQQHTHSAV